VPVTTDLYDPSRVTMGAVTDLAKENANVMAQYTERLTPGQRDSVDQIATDEGAVLRSGLSKVAVYRDENGTLHNRSAVCTHLGCVVSWNAAEKTWDLSVSRLAF